MDFPHHYQETDYTCGPAAMKMVVQGLLGEERPEAVLAAVMGTRDAHGTRQRSMLRFARLVGLAAFERHTDTTVEEVRALVADGHVVVVCYFLPEEGYDHYAVVQAIGRGRVRLLDPWYGPGREMSIEAFDRNWRSDERVATRRHRWFMAVRPQAARGPDAVTA